jgi:hypothetical protein
MDKEKQVVCSSNPLNIIKNKFHEADCYPEYPKYIKILKGGKTTFH